MSDTILKNRVKSRPMRVLPSTFENLSGPDARARRLERIRMMTGLDRPGVQNGYGISAGTLRSWESGRHPGLTEKGAKRMLELFQKEGIQCSLAWLMHGQGNIPVVLAESFIKEGVIPEEQQKQPFENAALAEEIAVFCKHHPQAIYFQVADDAMEPFYFEGDYVAGVRLHHESIHTLIGQTCIVETQQGEMLIRSLRPGTKKNCYTLQCLNIATCHTAPTVYDIELVSAASVIWHRRVV
jgi:HTH-type transcriptional regulator, cell division transcriptional repressor